VIKGDTPKQADVDRIFGQALIAAGGVKQERKSKPLPLEWHSLEKIKGKEVGPMDTKAALDQKLRTESQGAVTAVGYEGRM